MTCTYRIEFRVKTLVNTDPQRRCYDGCNYSSKLQWTAWEMLACGVTEESLERRLKFWKELNDYAVKERGNSAKREFRTVKEV